MSLPWDTPLYDPGVSNMLLWKGHLLPIEIYYLCTHAKCYLLQCSLVWLCLVVAQDQATHFYLDIVCLLMVYMRSLRSQPYSVRWKGTGRDEV